MPTWSYIIVAVAAYLLGSIPTGFLVARAKGIDIRKVGSGNIGATNTFRVVGKTAGIFVLLADCVKGYLACAFLCPLIYNLIEPHYFGLIVYFQNEPAELKMKYYLAAGIFAVLGHNYTCWLKFKGGKGIATTAGVYLALAPVALGIAFAVFILTILVTRYASVGSIVAAIALPVAVWFTNENSLLRIVTIALCLLAIYKHKSNIKRLMQGTESRLGKKSAREDARPTNQKESEATK